MMMLMMLMVVAMLMSVVMNACDNDAECDGDDGALEDLCTLHGVTRLVHRLSPTIFISASFASKPSSAC